MVRSLLNRVGTVGSRPRAGLWRDRRGASAVEFALIAFPFFGLLMGCLELAIVLFAGVSLDLAAAKVSRELRTGVTSKAANATAFATKVCAEMAWMGSDCASKLRVDVRTFTNFSLVTQAPDVIVDGEFANLQYTVGGGSEIQLVRVYYPWKVFTPLLKPGFSTLGSGEAVLSTVVVFKNEPF